MPVKPGPFPIFRAAHPYQSVYPPPSGHIFRVMEISHLYGTLNPQHMYKYGLYVTLELDFKVIKDLGEFQDFSDLKYIDFVVLTPLSAIFEI